MRSVVSFASVCLSKLGFTLRDSNDLSILTANLKLIILILLFQQKLLRKILSIESR